MIRVAGLFGFRPENYPLPRRRQYFGNLVASYPQGLHITFECISTLLAAAVTTRVRLVTNVVVATVRNAGVLAKQAARLDAISNGRLTLGMGVGARGDDFRAAPASFKDRGKRFEEQLDLMQRIWKGQPAVEGDRIVGPAPVRKGGPALLIGARSPSAIDRVGKWADGYLAPPYQPDVVKGMWEQALHVGDHPRNDIVGAKQTGLTAVWIRRKDEATEVVARLAG